MQLEANGLHHFALTVTGLERSKRFYTETLGFTGVLDVPGLALISGYGLLIGLHADDGAAQDRFDPRRVGLDHLALAAAASELDDLKQQLDAAGVANKRRAGRRSHEGALHLLLRP